MHGHRWEVTAEIELPVVPRSMVADDDESPGILVDFADIKEIWEPLDHTVLNARFTNPTAEVLANVFLEELCGLVDASLRGQELPYQATIVLWESLEAHVAVSIYQPTFPPEDEWKYASERSQTEPLDEALCCPGTTAVGIKVAQTLGDVASGSQVTGLAIGTLS
jgi:6-pyruvoyl-tetrahydropterin synthase